MAIDTKVTKFYRLYGVDSAIELLRPRAKWQMSNNKFTKWDDPRPCPTWKEIEQTMDKIKRFEDSLNVIWTDEQVAELTGVKPIGNT